MTFNGKKGMVGGMIGNLLAVVAVIIYASVADEKVSDVVMSACGLGFMMCAGFYGVIQAIEGGASDKPIKDKRSWKEIAEEE